MGANVAVGYQALKDITTGHSNVAIGYQACMDGTTLHNNTAIGTSAMANVTTGNGRNVVVGLSALNACTTGSQLTGVGQNALSSNTTGYMNVAVGSECLDALTTTIETVGVGYGAGSAVTTGGYSVYVGAYAGNLVTTGANNTCIGQRAGDTITDGANNVCIGYQTDVESGAGDSANQIVIGVSLTSPGDNYLVFGKSGNEVSNQFTSNASWSRSSDERIKTNIQDDTLGLSFINALKTKTFKWKPSNEVPQELTRHYHPVNQKDTDIVMHGLIAQKLSLHWMQRVSVHLAGGMKCQMDHKAFQEKCL